MEIQNLVPVLRTRWQNDSIHEVSCIGERKEKKLAPNLIPNELKPIRVIRLLPETYFHIIMLPLAYKEDLHLLNFPFFLTFC